MVQIDENSKLPLKLVALVVGAVVSAVLWLQATLLGLSARLDSLKVEVQSVKENIDSSHSDKWTGTDMAIWAERLKLANPSVTVPPVSPSGPQSRK